MLDKDPRWLHPLNREDAERRLKLLRARLDPKHESKRRVPKDGNVVFTHKDTFLHHRPSTQPRMKLEEGDERPEQSPHIDCAFRPQPEVTLETRRFLERHCGNSGLEIEFILGEISVDSTIVASEKRRDELDLDEIALKIIKADTGSRRAHTSIMASDMLVVDLFRKEQGICMEGTDAHDYHECLCSMYETGVDKHLLWATPNGLTTQAERILKFGPIFESDLTYCDAFGNTLLHFFAARAHPALLLRVLIEHDGLSRCLNTSGESFLHCLSRAWYAGDAIYLRVLLRHLACDNSHNSLDVYSKDIYGRSIFHLMAESIISRETLAELMELFDSDVYATRDAFGTVPEATRSKIPSQDHHKTDKQPDTLDPAEYQARLRETIDRVYACEDKRAENEGGWNGLHCTASIIISQNSLLAFNKIPNLTVEHPVLGKNFNHKKVEHDSSTKVFKKREDIMLDLIGLGVDVNAYDAVGNTVLMHFVAYLPEDDDQKTPVNIIDRIIESGADIQARNRVGETALHVAVRLGKKRAMRKLVTEGANVHARDIHGRTPLRTLADEIQKAGNDSVTYAHLEACFTWLSAQGEAKLRSSVLDEWGWFGLPTDRKTGKMNPSGKMNSTSLDEWYDELNANSVINYNARDRKSQKILQQLRDVLEKERNGEVGKIEWARPEGLNEEEKVKKLNSKYEDE